MDKILSFLWGICTFLQLTAVVMEPTDIERWALFLTALCLCITYYELFKVREENEKLKNENRSN